MKKILCILMCCAVLVACTDDKKYAPKEGRLTVFEAQITDKADGTVKLDAATNVSEWTHPQYNAQNKIPAVTVNLGTSKMWRERISKAATGSRQLPPPVVVGENLYVLDGAYQLTKVDVKTGKNIWQNTLADDATGAALVAHKDTLFAVSAEGFVTAMDLDGKQLWQKDLKVAMRSAPVADKNALYLITTHNRFIALNQKDGNEIWAYQTSKPSTQLTQMASPAKQNDILVVPFSTGEVIAFDADSGLILWIQMMVGNRPRDLVEIPQIAAAPIIEKGVVYLSGHANLTGAYNLKTGETKWTTTLGSRHTPVLSGNTLFVLTNQNELYALDKTNGRVFWKQEQKPIKDNVWQGLALFNEHVALYDNEHIITIDPETGNRIQTYDVEMNTTPIVVDKHLVTIDAKTKVTWHE